MYPTLSKITIVIADDHPYFRKGLQQALKENEQLHFIAEASNGLELCTLVEELKPHVVITDISMPLMGGIEATKHVKKLHPQTGVIALSMHDEVQIIKEVLQAGANAYLLKNAETKEINEAIFSTQKGMYYISSSASKTMATIFKYTGQDCCFTKREKEIIQLLFEEFTSSEIGEKLFLSKRTVEEHRKHIQMKTGARNVVGIIKYALQNRVVQLT